LIIEQIFLFF